MPMDTAPDTPTPARNARLITPWLALLLLTVLALALRFWRIAGQSLWLDEAASRAFSLLPPGLRVSTPTRATLRSTT